MRIVITKYISVEINQFILIIDEFEKNLNNYFYSRDYGEGLQVVFFGFTCVSPQFEQFFKPRKPVYTKSKGSFEYDIKLDFELLKNTVESECEKMLAKELLKSLNIIDDFSEKIKDFERVRFRTEMEIYLKKYMVA